MATQNVRIVSFFEKEGFGPIRMAVGKRSVREYHVVTSDELTSAIQRRLPSSTPRLEKQTSRPENRPLPRQREIPSLLSR